MVYNMGFFNKKTESGVIAPSKAGESINVIVECRECK